MAPTIAEIPQMPSQSLHLHHLFTRASTPNSTPLTSIFALIMYRAKTLAQSTSNALARSVSKRSADRSAAALMKLPAIKRQQQILVIPTTYANLRSSPKPGAVVGITLGAVFGVLLALFIIVYAFRFTYGRTEIVEEELVTRRRKSHSKKPSPSSSSASEAPPIPEPEIIVETRRSSRATRRESRRTSRMSRRTPDEVIVEEDLSSAHDEVIVEEEQSDVHTADEVVVEEEDEDIVEVIEEHSPEPPPRRKSSARRSATFRTVDPTAYGGGDAPSRRISRNTNRS